MRAHSLVVVLILMLSIIMSGCTTQEISTTTVTKTMTVTQTETATETITTTVTETETSAIIVTETHTSVWTITKTVTKTVTLTPQSIQNEAEGKVGEPVTASFRDYKGMKTVEVTVLEYIRGGKANQMIEEASILNSEPDPGYEYLLVKVRVKYVSGSGELLVGDINFRAFASGVGYDPAWVVMPDNTPKLKSASLIPGGVVEGWLAFEVPKGTPIYLKYYYSILEDPIISIEIPAEPTPLEGLTNETTSSPPVSMGIMVYVIRVMDGDTIEVGFPNGSVERVRFLGVDTPETLPSWNKPNEYDNITDLECLAEWGVKAKYFTEKYLLHRHVYLKFDPLAGRRDYYGRLLAYIYLENGTDFTALLVKEGYARVYVEGEFQKEEEYLKYQELAESKGIGLWECKMPRTTTTSISTSYSVVIVEIHYDAGGSSVNDREVLNDEYVVIENRGSTPVNLDGWFIKDEAGHTYYFPPIVLEPGERIVLHTGRGTNTEHDLYWGSSWPIWNNDHDTAYLYNAQGELVDVYSW